MKINKVLARNIAIAVLPVLFVVGAAVVFRRGVSGEQAQSSSLSLQDRYDAMRDREFAEKAKEIQIINKEIELKISYWARQGCSTCSNAKDRRDVVEAIVRKELVAEEKNYSGFNGVDAGGAATFVYHAMDKAEDAGMFR
jgi:hypothetical protein